MAPSVWVLSHALCSHRKQESHWIYRHLTSVIEQIINRSLTQRFLCWEWVWGLSWWPHIEQKVSWVSIDVVIETPANNKSFGLMLTASLQYVCFHFSSIFWHWQGVTFNFFYGSRYIYLCWKVLPKLCNSVTIYQMLLLNGFINFLPGRLTHHKSVCLFVDNVLPWWFANYSFWLYEGPYSQSRKITS